jgi:hypothetical protein
MHRLVSIAVFLLGAGLSAHADNVTYNTETAARRRSAASGRLLLRQPCRFRPERRTDLGGIQAMQVQPRLALPVRQATARAENAEVVRRMSRAGRRILDLGLHR